MGRTKRKRKRRASVKFDNTSVINLLKWLRLKNSNLQIHYFNETGRGIRSKKKIRIGDELIRLPLCSLITPKVSSKILSIINVDGLCPQLVLTLFLMYESHLAEKSEFRHYIELLPTSYSTLFFCSRKEALVLPHFMRIQVFQKKQEIKGHLENILTLCGSNLCHSCGRTFRDIFQYSFFTWAWFTVNTRSVYFKDDKADSLALAPLLDMFNHSFDAEIEAEIDMTRELYIIKSLREYKKKEQIFIKYGSLSNLKLLLEYGFILDNNPNDSVDFSYDEIIATLKGYKSCYGVINQKKYNLIKQNNLNENLTKSIDGFSWNYNALLYILITQDENLTVLRAKFFSNEFSEPEWKEIHEVSNLLIRSKITQLNDDLHAMELMEGVASPSFSLAIRLMKIYLCILQKDFKFTTD